MGLKKEKQIVLYAPSVHAGGGTERVLINLANSLIDRGFNVTIAIDVIGDKNFHTISDRVTIRQFWFGRLENLYPKSIILKMINRLLRTLFLELFLRTVIESKERLIICFSTSLTLQCFKTSFNKDIIAYEHWPYWINSRYPKQGRSIKRIYPKLKLIVVLTNYEKVVHNEIGCNNVEVITNAYSFLPEKPAALENKIVLSVGHFNAQKRRDLLVDAWQHVHIKNPDWKLIIVGDGPQKLETVHQIESMNLNHSIEILPPTSDIELYYHKSSIFVLSSEYEALPLVLLEAKVFGIPCVSFDVKSGPNEVLQDKKDGYLVNFPNTVEMANKINALIENESMRKEFGQEGRKDALKRFDPQLIYDRWNKLLNNINK